MAKDSQNAKRGPGRPPGSKNKNNNSGGKGSSSKNGQKAVTPEQVRQERIERMQAEYDRDRRNVDVIWSITLFAVGIFLFFTVVMNSTGSIGSKVHNLCLGLFGLMAYALPFMIIIFGILLLAGKMQHIGGRTIFFSFLIFINMCILNSYRFINEPKPGFGFDDIAGYYIDGTQSKGGGFFGMELGSILVYFFGKPGLLIIAIAVLIISIFLVANTPISRGLENLSRKIERKRIMRELEAAETDKIQWEVARTATPGADPRTGISDALPERNSVHAETAAAPKRSVWRSILSGIAREEDPEPVPTQGDALAALVNKENRQSDTDELDYKALPPQKDDSVIELVKRDTLFGKLSRKIRGGASDDEDRVGYNEYKTKTAEPEPEPDKEPARVRMNEKRHYGLNDPDYEGHPGAYGLTGTAQNNGKGEPSGHSYASGNAAGAGIASSYEERRARKAKLKEEEASSPSVSHSSKTHSDASSERREGTRKKAPSETQRTETSDDSAENALAESFNAPSDDTSYVMPPVSLLKKGTGSRQLASDYQLEEKANLLEKTLSDFGVDARVLTVTQGASVTRYEVQPATGVKVSSITRLADDIALNLRAKTIRIEAPIPGKAAVGIEVENDKPSPVLVRELIDSEEFMRSKSKITFVVGKDISGNNIVADLKDMPHLLIAGATGSGKSVCINTIISSFLYKAKPSELKLIMIDPKVVELANYNGIPHMLTPVVTDARKASRALAIAVQEMDKRYELFAKEGVKDLESYNELMRANHEYANCKPQVVIIIDELADLMMAASAEVENSICRLAQKARAAGMHLIVATQRPSVDVVTGLIKANIPSRIAFSVASQFDSKTILDMAGAEKLLGKGDMLFSPVGASKPYRVQGPYISDSETEKIIKFVKKEGGGPVYDEELKNAIDSDEKKGGAEPQDELTEDAIAFILKSRQASVSMLQRRFRIGYNRAARIIDEIEEKGIIGPSDGSRPRQVMITEDEYYGGGADEEEIDEYPDEGYEEYDAQDHAAGPAEAEEPDEEYGNEDEEEDEPEYETVGASPLEIASAATGRSVESSGANSAVDYFNSLPESVRKQLIDADYRYDD